MMVTSLKSLIDAGNDLHSEGSMVFLMSKLGIIRLCKRSLDSKK